MQQLVRRRIAEVRSDKESHLIVVLRLDPSQTDVDRPHDTQGFQQTPGNFSLVFRDQNVRTPLSETRKASLS